MKPYFRTFHNDLKHRCIGSSCIIVHIFHTSLCASTGFGPITNKLTVYRRILEIYSSECLLLSLGKKDDSPVGVGVT